jgi:hypothetical protein
METWNFESIKLYPFALFLMVNIKSLWNINSYRVCKYTQYLPFKYPFIYLSSDDTVQ